MGAGRAEYNKHWQCKFYDRLLGIPNKFNSIDYYSSISSMALFV